MYRRLTYQHEPQFRFRQDHEQFAGRVPKPCDKSDITYIWLLLRRLGSVQCSFVISITSADVTDRRCSLRGLGLHGSHLLFQGSAMRMDGTVHSPDIHKSSPLELQSTTTIYCHSVFVYRQSSPLVLKPQSTTPSAYRRTEGTVPSLWM